MLWNENEKARYIVSDTEDNVLGNEYEYAVTLTRHQPYLALGDNNKELAVEEDCSGGGGCGGHGHGAAGGGRAGSVV